MRKSIIRLDNLWNKPVVKPSRFNVNQNIKQKKLEKGSQKYKLDP